MKSTLMLLFKDIHFDARVIREATALARSGWQVYVACLDIYAEEPPQLHPNVTLIRIPITTKRLKRNVDQSSVHGATKTQFIYKIIRNPLVKLVKDVWAQREFREKVLRELADRQIDVIHCHDLNTLNTGVSLSKKLNIPHLIYDSHELYNEMNGKKPFEKRVGYLLEKRYIQHADFVITVNEYLKDALANRYQLTNVLILRNCQPLYTVETGRERYFHQRYGLADSEQVVLYQGGLTPSRGLEQLIQAVKLLPEHVHVVLLGYGDLKPHLASLVCENALQDRVHFHEAVPPARLLDLTCTADAGVVLYQNTCENNYLSTPNKIFEYMQAEIPVVSSNHPGKAIIINEAETGVLVDSEDPHSIADGIVKALNDKAHYVANCIKFKQTFSWEEEQNKLVELYARIG